MIIYLVQHGIAVDKTLDVTRPLSEEGKHKVKLIAQQLSHQNLVIDTIYHSGKPRALQTAELFAQKLRGGQVQSSDGLNPNDEVEPLLANLQDNCMYVGHLPHLQKLASQLVSGQQDTAIVEFENAAVLCLNISSNGACIDWFVKPSLLVVE